MLATGNPPEANRRGTQLLVRKEIGIAHAATTAGLRELPAVETLDGGVFHAPRQRWPSRRPNQR